MILAKGANVLGKICSGFVSNAFAFEYYNDKFNNRGDIDEM